MGKTTVSQYLARLRRDAAAMARRYKALHPERQAELRSELERTRAELESILARVLK